MKVISQVSKGLNLFRSFSPTHPIVFKWTGSAMKAYQNGVTRTFSGVFLGAIMPETECKGIILPKLINQLIDAQEVIDANPQDIMLSPIDWGYRIHSLKPNGEHTPNILMDLKFYSVKGWLPLLFANLIPSFRVSLKNL